jgi:hypothetical protein
MDIYLRLNCENCEIQLKIYMILMILLHIYQEDLICHQMNSKQKDCVQLVLYLLRKYDEYIFAELNSVENFWKKIAEW